MARKIAPPLRRWHGYTWSTVEQIHTNESPTLVRSFTNNQAIAWRPLQAARFRALQLAVTTAMTWNSQPSLKFSAETFPERLGTSS
jgi:hypothetical protein